MDQIVLTTARETFGETFKTYKSPNNTTFIEGVAHSGDILISYNPGSCYYVVTVNDKPVLLGVDKRKVLNFLEMLS